jgi:hypothetical protein
VRDHYLRWSPQGQTAFHRKVPKLLAPPQSQLQSFLQTRRQFFLRLHKTSFLLHLRRRTQLQSQTSFLLHLQRRTKLQRQTILLLHLQRRTHLKKRHLLEAVTSSEQTHGVRLITKLNKLCSDLSKTAADFFLSTSALTSSSIKKRYRVFLVAPRSERRPRTKSIVGASYHLVS